MFWFSMKLAKKNRELHAEDRGSGKPTVQTRKLTVKHRKHFHFLSVL